MELAPPVITENEHCILSLSLSLSLSLRFNGHFPGGPGLVGTRMCPFWILLELWMMEVVVTAGAIARAKLSSQNISTDKPTPIFFTGRMSCQSTEGITADIALKAIRN